MDDSPKSSLPHRVLPGPSRWAPILLLILLSLGLAFYHYNAFSFFLADDEGNYAYAAWRISAGEVPYRDFLSSQQPVFLYWGGLLVRLFGRSFVPLRVATAIVTLLAGYLLYATNREILGQGAALLSLALFLVEPRVFSSARFFMPEAYMLLFQMAGLYAFVLGQRRGRLHYVALAGLLFGLSTLSKLFGVLPLAGCFLYLVFAWRRERRPLRQVLREGLALGAPALLLVGLVALTFTKVTPYFLTAVLGHHMMQGAGMPLAERVGKALYLYGAYIAGQPLAAAIAVLGAWVVLRRKKALPSLLVWQVPTALVFAGFSRDLYERHLVYLAPTLVTLLAASLVSLLGVPRRLYALKKPWNAGSVVIALSLFFLLVLETIRPWMLLDTGHMALQDYDSSDTVALIQTLSSPDEMVLADYPGLNFLAGRQSTYWAAEMSRGGAESGQIRGSALIDEIEQGDVAMVLLHISGRDPQIRAMIDFADFRRYVQSHFYFLDTLRWTHNQQVFEVYARADTMPLRPGLDYGGDLALDGLRLEDATVRAGSSLEFQWRWRALRPMADDYYASVCLVDAAGHQWAEAHVGLADSYTAAPTSTWRAQQGVLMRQKMALSSSMPAGNYYLAVQAYRRGSGFIEPAGSWSGLEIGGMPVLSRVRVLPKKAPNPDDLPVDHWMSTSLAEGLALLGGGHLSGHPVGQELSFCLYWQATRQLTEDYRLEFCLMDGGEVRQRWPVELAEGLPTSEWQEGQVVLESYDLPLGQDMGESDLWLRVLDSEGQEAGRVKVMPLTASAGSQVGAGRPALPHPVADISFGDYFGLLGYDLSTEEVHPGETVTVTLYWAYTRPSTIDYTVFIHLLDEASQIQGQADLIPQGGGTLSAGWVMGDVLIDRFQVPVKAETPARTLRVVLGFYDQATGERLPVLREGQLTEDDSLVLPTPIAVTRPS